MPEIQETYSFCKGFPISANLRGGNPRKKKNQQNQTNSKILVYKQKILISYKVMYV